MSENLVKFEMYKLRCFFMFFFINNYQDFNVFVVACFQISVAIINWRNFMADTNKELKIEQNKENGKLLCKLSGWLDPNTSPDLMNKLDLNGVKELVLDMSAVEYVFSAGLRAILMLQRLVEYQGGTIKLVNLSDDVRNIFECTGLDGILEPKA